MIESVQPSPRIRDTAGLTSPDRIAIAQEFESPWLALQAMPAPERFRRHHLAFLKPAHKAGQDRVVEHPPGKAPPAGHPQH